MGSVAVMPTKEKFIFWALSSHGQGISGVDRIYIEFARRWSKQFPLAIVTWQEGIAMIARNKLFPSPYVRSYYIQI